MRLPMGFSFGHHFLAMDSLMMTTGGDLALSNVSNNRPASNGICSVRKYSLSATLNGELEMSACFGTGRSPTMYTDPQQPPVNGVQRIALADVTPGNCRMRAMA